jgi:hypothetical protein
MSHQRGGCSRDDADAGGSGRSKYAIQRPIEITPYVDEQRVARIWRLNPNWTFVIVGAVILLAVSLDQVVRLLQSTRRTRAAP